MSAAASKLVPGATSFAVRNNADSANNLIITDAGAMTVRTSLTVTTSATVTTSLTVGTDLTVDTSTLKVDSTNNRVGIGTASPSARFHVAESTQSNALIRLSNTGNSTGLQNWQIVNQSDGRLEIQSTNDAFSSVNATALVMENTTGYVGLGVASPQGKIHVYDTDGGVLFWRGANINTTPQTVLTGLTALGTVTVAAVASNGTIDVNSITLIPSGFQTLFGGELRVDTSAGGTVTIYRASGTKTFDVTLWIVYR